MGLGKSERYVLFLLGCIGSRVLLAYIAKTIDKDNLPYMGYVCLLPAIGMMYIYVTGSRDYGIEAGGKIWWNNLRPIHSLVYFLFAYNAIMQNEYAWMFLAVDVFIGLSAFIVHHFLHW
jgi:hypothetical protein